MLASFSRARGLTRRQFCCKSHGELKGFGGGGARRACLLYYYGDIKNRLPGVRARA